MVISLFVLKKARDASKLDFITPFCIHQRHSSIFDPSAFINLPDKGLVSRPRANSAPPIKPQFENGYPNNPLILLEPKHFQKLLSRMQKLFINAN